MSLSAGKMDPVERYLRSYLKGGDLPGWWIGEGPQILGFGGIIAPGAIWNVFHNRTPDGEKWLVYSPNRISTPANSREQTAGWFFTFRVPQEVSAAWAVGPDNLASQIQGACFNAANRTVEFAEKHAAWVGVGRMKHLNAKLIVAYMPQTLSKALGPELQMRCLISPAGVGPDGVVRRLSGRPLFRHKMALDAMFRSTLAHELSQMGFRCVPFEGSFKVQGIPEKLCEHFAKRRLHVVGSGDGVSRRSIADINVLLARDLANSYGQGRKHLRELWRIEAARLGVTPETIAAATRPSLMTRFQQYVGITPQGAAQASVREAAATPREGSSVPSPKVGQLLRQSFDTWYVRRAIDRRHNATDFIRHALDASIGSGIDPQVVLREMDLWAANELSWPETPKHHASIKMCQRDIAFLVRQMRDDRGYVLRDASVRKVLDMYSAPRDPRLEGIRHGLLTHEKTERGLSVFPINQALVHRLASQTLKKEGQSLALTLTRRRGRVVVVSHRTTDQRELALRAAASAWRNAGYEAIAVTSDRRAAQQLEHATCIASIPRGQFQLVQPNESIKNQAQVLIVDQAHQVSLNDLKQLISYTKEHGGKLVLLTPRIDELPNGRSNMSAVLLDGLSQRPSEIIDHQFGRSCRRQEPRTPQARPPGMEMS